MTKKKGKNFSCNNAEGKRKKSDFYETPYSMTQSILDRELSMCKAKSILEPMCGHGAIVSVLQENGFSNITAYDLVNGTDFFEESGSFDIIITNPAFSVAKETILKAKKLASEKVILLLPLSYLHGKERYDLIYNADDSFRLKSVYVFTRYPMLGEQLRKDGKYNTGMMVYAWFVFENGYTGKPEIDWIDNNHMVISKKETTMEGR